MMTFQTDDVRRAGAIVTLTFAMLAAAGCRMGPDPRPHDASPSNAAPETLFLSWQDDPTTTMTVQWLEMGERLPVVSGGTLESPAHAVAYLPEVSIDGNAADWGDGALHVDFLPDADGALPDPDTFDASARLGWNEAGLLVLVEVRTDHCEESDDVGALFAGDSVELFVSTGVGSAQRYQVIVAPGADPQQDEPRYHFFDRREDDSAGDLAIELAATHEQGRYTVEMLLPWDNLGLEAGQGADLAFQVQVNDRGADGESRNAAWYPDGDSFRNPWARRPLRLVRDAAEASPAVRARAVLEERDYEPVAVRVYADETYVGERVTLHAGARQLDRITLAKEDGRAVGRFSLPRAPAGEQWGTLRVAGEADGTLAHVSKPGWMTHAPPETVETRYFRMDGLWEPRSIRTEVQPFVNSPGYFVHRAHLTDLEPDTDYTVALNDHEGLHRFRTAPATLDEPITLILAGDIDVGEASVKTHKAAAEQSPLVTVIAGDLSYADGVDPERKVQFLAEWSEHAITPEGLRIPMLAGIGNHEVIGGYGGDRRDAPFFYSLFDQLYPETGFATVDLGDYLSFIMLDSDHSSEIPGEQTAFVERALSEREHFTHRMPVYHIPAWPSVRDFDGRVNVLVREHWVPLFEQHDIDVVFETHDHAYKRTHRIRDNDVDEETGVLYLGDGPWGAGLRTPATPEERWYLARTEEVHHFIRADYGPDGRRFTAIDNEGNAFDEYPVDE